ncbi:hypothetical protein [Rhodococcus sp. NPDC059234]|uniref:hypothetical protein n=1 Tax=Rhodococcus sp. NPDC059234 TaxID=3346781 RepID=UPI00367206AE
MKDLVRGGRVRRQLQMVGRVAGAEVLQHAVVDVGCVGEQPCGEGATSSSQGDETVDPVGTTEIGEVVERGRATRSFASSGDAVCHLKVSVEAKP